MNHVNPSLIKEEDKKPDVKATIPEKKEEIKKEEVRVDIPAHAEEVKNENIKTENEKSVDDSKSWQKRKTKKEVPLDVLRKILD